jgi:ABC-2 type transport system ATP-binding protein
MSEQRPSPATVRLEGVTVFYGEVMGLSGLSFDLAPGITGLVGPNGSGKSTLMRVITGLVRPREGRAEVLGGDPFQDDRVRARVALVPTGECFSEGATAFEAVRAAFLARGDLPQQAKLRAERAIVAAGLEDARHRAVGACSRGMRQRLKLGLAMELACPVVLLDEPFLGVDPPSRRRLRDLVQTLGSAGATVVIASHVLGEIESLTDQVLVLMRGRLLGAGTVGTLLRSLADRHPHRVELHGENLRALAAGLVGLDHVVAVEVAGPSSVRFLTNRPDTAYRDLARLVVATDAAVWRVESADDSLEALFRSLTQAGAQQLSA